MLCVKKIYRDELLHLALILSLLRVNPDSYLGYDVPEIGIGDLSNGTSWAHVHTETLIHRRLYIHPKSLDSVLLNYEQEVFDDLNALGRYNRINSHPYDVAAYHLNLDDGSTTSDPRPTLQSDFEALSIDSGRESNASISSPHNDDRPSTSDSEEGMFLSLPHNPDVEPGLSTGDPHAAELTQEDMDLIEVLWKQDVDLGFSLDLFNAVKENGNRTEVAEDDLEKLKALQALKNDDSNLKLKTEEPDDDSCSGDDPWAGLAYTVDLETGEYVLKSEREPDELTSAGGCLTDEEPSALLDLPEFSLEEALQLVGLDEDSQELKPIKTEEEAPVSPLPLEPESLDWSDDCEDELGILGDMIQTPQFHPPHPRAFQGRMPYSRTMSMEQRWQDLANLLSLPGDGSGMAHPFAHHHHHHHHHHNFSGAYNPDARSVLLHNATLAPPMGDLNSSSPYTMSSAVATSMNLTNSSEPMGDGGPTVGYKMDTPHDMMYFQNSTPEIPVNQTTEGFLSSILDEDLQLMDMAMNEGMYTMRMLESNTSNNATSVGAPPEERMDASSDSAVSSMGSERVSSLSDGEWMETGSDSGHMPADSYAMDYHASKYRPYDYSYSSRKHSTPPVGPADNSHRMPPMAQKKHQMFGKRSYFQNTDGSSLGSHGSVPSMPPTPVPIKYEYGVETGAIAPGNAFGSPVEGAVGPKPPEMKYSCSMDFIRHHTDQRSSLGGVQHNHTYHLPPESTGAMHRPHARDKHKGRRSEEEHLNRDEKRARAMNVPITVNDIINLPMDEFNERLSKYDLSEAQLSLIRDIRRRGKNKVAAQNCRKRKLDQIITLADEVKDMRDRKLRLLQERDFMLSERQRVKEKFSQLYRHIFQALRDPDGNPYSSYEYSLQQSADGTVLLVPRSNTTMLEPDLARPKHKEHEHQHKE